MNPILVTGGAKGLGSEICLQLAKKGFDVVVHYCMSHKQAEDIVEKCLGFGVQAAMIQGDFSNEKTIHRFISSYKMKFKKTRGIVNNVGNYYSAPSAKTKRKIWLSLMETNLFAPIFITSALLERICKEKGSIVNIGVSGISPARAKSTAPAYMVTKMGLWSYTLSLAKEMASQSVNVNMVSPGYMEESIDLPKKLPTKRPALFSEVAEMVAFLFTQESHYIMGQNIEIAGGYGL